MSRAGALQQLEAYGKRLNVPVKKAPEPDDLATAIEEARDRFVLVDTTSVNPFLQEEIVKLRSFVDVAGADRP